MTFFNRVLRALVDLALLPFRATPEWLSLALFSLLLAVVALLVYKWCSNQEAIERIKNKMAASIFEIRLFNDDLRAILRAQGHLLGNNLRYMALNLVPLVVMTILILPLFAQLQFIYGYAGLEVGEPAVIAVELDEPLDASTEPTAAPAIQLRAPEGVRVETTPIWAPARNAVAWRVVGEEPGHYELALDVDGRETTKSLVVSDRLARRSPSREKPGFLHQLLYPAEDPLPEDGPIDSIALDYADHDVEIFGLGTHWSIWLLVLSVIFALMLRKRFGVTF